MKNKVKKIIIELLDNSCKHLMPVKAHKSDSCYDLFSAVGAEIETGKTFLISSGFKMQLPKKYEAQIRPRSGNTLKKGFQVQLGTIDNGYTGEVGIIITNISDSTVVIEPGQKIAQMFIGKVAKTEILEGIIKKETERKDGGFGSTGN